MVCVFVRVTAATEICTGEIVGGVRGVEERGPMLRAMRDTVAAGRYGNEAGTAAATVCLLSPAASFISGSVWRVDGARPQVRMGWGQIAAPLEVQARDAVKPFDGLHRAVVPKVFA